MDSKVERGTTADGAGTVSGPGLKGVVGMASRVFASMARSRSGASVMKCLAGAKITSGFFGVLLCGEDGTV